MLKSVKSPIFMQTTNVSPSGFAEGRSAGFPGRRTSVKLPDPVPQLRKNACTDDFELGSIA